MENENETKPDIIAMLSRRVAKALDAGHPMRIYAIGIGSAGSDLAKWKGGESNACVIVDNLAIEVRPGYASAALRDFAEEVSGWMFEGFNVCIFAARQASIDKHGTVDIHLREIGS
jgi:hypothetical protein